MKSLIQQARYFGSTASKALVALILVTGISVLSIESALADRNNGHGRGNRNNNQDHREWRRDHNGYGPRSGYQQSYGKRNRNRQPYYNYAQPVYIPPPVYYGPMPSPGISLFFPLDLRRR